jgi:hypothetical protein
VTAVPEIAGPSRVSSRWSTGRSAFILAGLAGCVAHPPPAQEPRAPEPSDAPDTSAPDEPPPRAEIGQTDPVHFSFTPNSGRWTLVPGPSGGYFVESSVRICGLGARVWMALDLFDDRTNAWIGGFDPGAQGGEHTLTLTEAADGCGETLWEQVWFAWPFSSRPHPPELFTGCTLRLRIRAFDEARAKQAEAEATGAAVPDPANVSPQGEYVWTDSVAASPLGGCDPSAR